MVINTHLLYPHNACSTIIRLREVHKILEYLQARAAPWGTANMQVSSADGANGLQWRSNHVALIANGCA